MKKTMIIFCISVLFITISFSGCFEDKSEDKAYTGSINRKLNYLNIVNDENFNGYKLEAAYYNDSPPSQNGIDAIDTYSLVYSSTENNDNATINLGLIRLDSSYTAQETLNFLVSYLPLKSGLNQIYAEPFNQIGDESILYAYYGKETFDEIDDQNKTSIVLVFRIKNIVGFVEKYVQNIDNIDYGVNQFDQSNLYNNYCNEVYNFSIELEKIINSHITQIEGKEPKGKILETIQLKNTSTGKTVLMTIDDYVKDLLETDPDDLLNHGSFLFVDTYSLHIPNPGDILILKGNISNIEYDSYYDYTIISFNISFAQYSFRIYIQGNINDTYNLGDEVEMTLHIMEVTFSYLGKEYTVRLIDETWFNLKYYLYYMTYINSIDILLPQDVINKI